MPKTDTSNKSIAAPTVTWRVANLERNVADGKVIVVHYTLDTTDGTYSAGAYGSIGVDGEVTVQFKDLTESVVLDWVKDQLGPDKVAEVERALAEQLDNQRAPKVASGLPWAAAA